MGFKVNRQTLVANEATEFKFNVKGSDFDVTNFTSGNIYVSRGENFDENANLLVPAECSRTIVDNIRNKYGCDCGSLWIKAETDGIVEVHCTNYEG